MDAKSSERVPGRVGAHAGAAEAVLGHAADAEAHDGNGDGRHDLMLEEFRDMQSEILDLVKNSQDKRREFMLEEYRALRSEILELIKEIRFLDSFAVTSIGVVWAWLLVEQPGQPALAQKYYIGLWLPLVISLVLLSRRVMVSMSMMMAGDYISDIEKIIYKNSDDPGAKLGWETRLRSQESNKWFLYNFPVHFVFWSVVLILSAVVPAIVMATLNR